MPDLVRLVVVTAVFIETVITRIASIVRGGAAATRIAGAARASVGRVDRIVSEAQELLVPIREDAPMAGHALHRPPLVMLDQFRMSSTAPVAVGRVSTTAISPRQPRSLRGFDGLDSRARAPGAPNPLMDPERGHS